MPAKINPAAKGRVRYSHGFIDSSGGAHDAAIR